MKISTRATRRTSSRLHLSNVTTSDSGVYRCRARVKGYSDVAEAEVIVRKSAKFDEQKKKENNNSNPPETTSAERGHSSLLLAESTTPNSHFEFQLSTADRTPDRPFHPISSDCTSHLLIDGLVYLQRD
ncbi:Oidioi.mRNA.OKI2018_I69.chr2.g5825.t1.cds [Oikopleura dioica]|uniref:Oidioi.mRNA.OKI2018_I69.chr2.g5825.t1.cds n=1 Tax=Oikopleura dioica TaxID=34765 RepID=A0ABN7T4Q1_OIKDI|nr:Oidioi.mRNA.OKI2018_I69.chr2.g5825.t1.cds [Oikopleura dioica]